METCFKHLFMEMEAVRSETTMALRPNFQIQPNFVEMALQHFGGRDVSYVELCKFAGFTADELKFAELFWSPAFNNENIYLSDTIITKFLTNENCQAAVIHFITRKLIKKYEKGLCWTTQMCYNLITNHINYIYV
jgi:hypothetical protein